MTIHSWSNEAAIATSRAPQHVISYSFEIKDIDLAKDIYEIAEAALLTNENSPLKNAIVSVFSYDDTSLASCKEAKWTEIKHARASNINANMLTPYGTFECTPEDRNNITDAVLLSQTLSAQGQPVALTWTLADNSIVTLDAAQITVVGLLLGQKVQTAHATARAIRAAVEAATTIVEVNLISWP